MSDYSKVQHSDMCAEEPCTCGLAALEADAAKWREAMRSSEDGDVVFFGPRADGVSFGYVQRLRNILCTDGAGSLLRAAHATAQAARRWRTVERAVAAGSCVEMTPARERRDGLIHVEANRAAGALHFAVVAEGRGPTLAAAVDALAEAQE